MKFYLAILIFLIAKPVLPQCIGDEEGMYDYRLTGISIEGSTNVNRFSFLYENPPITPVIRDSVKDDEGYDGVDFSIPLRSFTGTVPAMKEDFLDLLKADTYPEVVVALENNLLNCLPGPAGSEKITLTVILAGVRRLVSADFVTLAAPDRKIVLRGSTRFLLSDFKLDPPQKALGLIHVNNEVIIKFDIVVGDGLNNRIQATK